MWAARILVRALAASTLLFVVSSASVELESQLRGQSLEVVPPATVLGVRRAQSVPPNLEGRVVKPDIFSARKYGKSKSKDSKGSGGRGRKGRRKRRGKGRGRRRKRRGKGKGGRPKRAKRRRRRRRRRKRRGNDKDKTSTSKSRSRSGGSDKSKSKRSRSGGSNKKRSNSGGSRSGGSKTKNSRSGGSKTKKSNSGGSKTKKSNSGGSKIKKSNSGGSNSGRPHSDGSGDSNKSKSKSGGSGSDENKNPTEYFCTKESLKTCYDPCKDNTNCAEKDDENKELCKYLCWHSCCRDDDIWESYDDEKSKSKSTSKASGGSRSKPGASHSGGSTSKPKTDTEDSEYVPIEYYCTKDALKGCYEPCKNMGDCAEKEDEEKEICKYQCWDSCCRFDDWKDEKYKSKSKSKSASGGSKSKSAPKSGDSDKVSGGSGPKMCNSDKESQCRDDCFANKNCGADNDDECKRECRFKCCNYDDDDVRDEDPSGGSASKSKPKPDADDSDDDDDDDNDKDSKDSSDDSVKLCNSNKERECRDQCFEKKDCDPDDKSKDCRMTCRFKCCDFEKEDSDDEDSDDSIKLCSTDDERECRDNCFDRQDCDPAQKFSDCHRECRFDCCDVDSDDNSDDRPEDGKCHVDGEKALECGADRKDGRYFYCCKGHICSDDRTCVKDPDASDSDDDEPLCNTNEENDCKSECYEENCDEGEMQCRKDCRKKCCVRSGGSRDSDDSPTRSPTKAPTGTAKPTIEELSCNGINQGQRARLILMSLSLISDVDDLLDLDTPQGQAYDWIVREDRLRLCPLDDNLEQRYALAVLYFSTEGRDWDDCSADDRRCAKSDKFPGAEPWLSKESECSWAGISCNARSEVRDLEIPDNNLRGTIPSEIKVLKNLDVIGLEENKLEGTIPEEFNESLVRLRLNNNRLTGEVGPLPVSLSALYLNSNQLEGDLDDVIGSLRNLRQLQLNDNRFTGGIPDSLADIRDLRIARFEQNKLEGFMPRSVCRQKEDADENDDIYLSVLSVDCDRVECDCCSPACDGSEPSSPSNPTRQPTRRPPTNDGDGTCPGYSDDDRIEEIFNILTDVSDENDLNDLDASHGKALVWLLSQDNRELCPDDETLVQRYILAVLYFSTDGDNWTECSQNDNNCNRNGEAWLSDTSECNWGGVTCNQKGFVDTIELDSNNLDGTLPIEMKNLEFMDVLNFENNRLRGALLEEFNDTLIRLRLNRNDLTGTIPRRLSSRLVALYLSDNRLEGTLNDLLEGTQLLNRLELENNRLSGEIPQELAELTNLKIARFNNNDFRGSMPNEVCDELGDSIAILSVDCDKVDCDCCKPSCR